MTAESKQPEAVRDSVEARPGRDGSGCFVLGALIGGFIGALITLWKAPRSGKEIRRMLQSRGHVLISEVELAAGDVRRQIEGETLEELLAAGKAEARRLNRRE